MKIICLPSSAAMVGIGKPKILEKISLIFDTNGPTSSWGIPNRSFRSAPIEEKNNNKNIDYFVILNDHLPAQNTLGTKLRKRTHRIWLLSFKLSIVASN